MEDFFTGIQWFFETILLAPYNALANLELESWWLANFMSWIFILIYFLLVLGFAFFYVSITFNTDQVSESIQKRGGYIPGIRP